MTRDELLAKIQAGGATADDSKAPEGEKRSGALNTGVSKFLSTVSGGGADYLDLLVRRYAHGEDTDIDKIREGYKRDEEANPMSAMAGSIAGTAAQAIPAAGILNKVGWLSKAPGIIGGVKSGAAIGAGTGAFNEAAYQADRLGSDKKAAEEYSLGGSGLRFGKEVVAGAGGGMLGGVIGNLAGKGRGMIANTAKAPLDEATVQAAMAGAKDTGRLGMTGPGKVGPEEALRLIKDPALRHGAADTAAALEGRMAQAGEQYASKTHPGMSPKEASRSTFRDNLYADSADASSAAAKTARTAAADSKAADAARAGLRGEELNVPAYWAAQGSPRPGLVDARKALVDQQRALLVAQQRAATPPATVAAADKAAAAAHPYHNVGALEDVIAAPGIVDPIKDAARKALYEHNPAFKAADDATAAMKTAALNASARKGHLDELGDVLQGGALGRQMAQKPNQPAPNLPGYSPTKIGLDLLKVVHDKLSKGAVKNATDRMIDEPLEEMLRQIGRRTTAQNVTQRASYPLGSYILGNVGVTP